MLNLENVYQYISVFSVEPGEGSGTHEINLCTGGEDGCIKTWRSSPLAPDDNVDNAALSVSKIYFYFVKVSSLFLVTFIFFEILTYQCLPEN